MTDAQQRGRVHAAAAFPRAARAIAAENALARDAEQAVTCRAARDIGVPARANDCGGEAVAAFTPECGDRDPCYPAAIAIDRRESFSSEIVLADLRSRGRLYPFETGIEAVSELPTGDRA